MLDTLTNLVIEWPGHSYTILNPARKPFGFTDLILTGGCTYVTLAGAHFFIIFNTLKKDGLEVAKDGLKGAEFWREKTVFSPPFYINTGGAGSLSVPVSGGTETKQELVFSQYNSPSGSSYLNYDALDQPNQKSWINSADRLSAVFEQYGINPSVFPARLPIKLCEYSLPGPVYLDQRAGVLSSQRRPVALRAAWARRLPLSLTVAAVTTVGALMAWT